MVKLITSEEARKILAIQGQRPHIRTFNKWIKEGKIKVVQKMGRYRFFNKKQIIAFSKKFPKKRPSKGYSYF